LRNTISKYILFALTVIISYQATAQDSFPSIQLKQPKFIRDENGFRIYPYNNKRVAVITAANIAGYSAALIALNAAWYSKYPKSSFHFFNDNAEWLQVDKAGHMYGSYIGSRGSNELWRWSGLDRKKRIWISGLSGIAYEGIIETLDGFSSGYGWSWGDVGANVLGSAFFTVQELAWNDQRMKLKFSFHNINYRQPDLIKRANAIYGSTAAERLIKDYNAGTTWLSIDIKPFVPSSNLPPWLAVAFGYGAQGMFGARSNRAYDKEGNITFDRRDISRYRQWYLSPDIDLSKIKTNKRGLRFMLNVLSAFKFPMPAFEFSQGKIKARPLYF
jgi:uncharacterized protein YfiM (DUF2279 family)